MDSLLETAKRLEAESASLLEKVKADDWQARYIDMEQQIAELGSTMPTTSRRWGWFMAGAGAGIGIMTLTWWLA